LERDLPCEKGKGREFLRRLAAFTFVSFEECLIGLYHNRLPDWKPFFAWMLTHQSAAKGVPLPDNWEEHGEHFIWSCSLWRSLVASYFSTFVCPASRDAGELEYQAVLFLDTHLDVLTTCARNGRYQDELFFAHKGALLAQVYPSANRVCCAEELPDLTPFMLFANLFFDSGSKKTSRSVARAIAHVFLCKVMNQICQVRHLNLVLVAYMRRLPLIAQLFRLVLRCVLLGNLPRALHRPELAARIKIHGTFVVNPLEGKNAKPELDEAGLESWVNEKRHVVMFALREFFLYTCEAGMMVDEMLGVNLKWKHFKEIVRFANGSIREEMNRQAQVCFSNPMDWDPIERIRVSTNSRGKVTRAAHGTIMNFHALSLGTFKKLKKGRAEEIIYKVPRLTPLPPPPHLDGKIYC
jgi:hypothetical protein